MLSHSSKKNHLLKTLIPHHKDMQQEHETRSQAKPESQD
jgi:hypothetical protein